MLKQIENLSDHLRLLNDRLATISNLAATLHDTGLLEDLAKTLPRIGDAIRHVLPPEPPKLFMKDVLGHLCISERTYYRKIAEGKLVPRKWAGPDFFYPSDLVAERSESKRRGRI